MPTIKIKVDLECSRCSAKIQKVLTRIQEKGEFCIDTIHYDEKNNKVIVSGPFDAEKLAEKLCCKACKIIKEIEIVEPPPTEKTDPPPPTEKEETPPPVVVVEPPVVVVEPPPAEKEEPPPAEKEESQPPPPPKYVEVPYPFPYPYPFPAWPQQCCWKPCPCYDQHGHGGCRCCSCGRAYEEPAPPLPAPGPAPQPVQYAPAAPWPCNGYKIVCEEDPSYACSIM